jgi:tetratricopeptide (TPR) repeat protein
VIYRNPRTLRPFAVRGDPGPLDSTLAVTGEPTGAEGAHYLQLALDYEFFGFIRQAQESYLLALRFGRTEPKSYVYAGTWLARALWRQGRRQEAIELVRWAEAAAPGPLEASQLAGVRVALLAGNNAALPAPRSAGRPRPQP